MKWQKWRKVWEVEAAIGGEEEGIGTEVEEVLVVAVVGHVVVVEVYHVQEVEVETGVVEVTVEIGEGTELVPEAAVHVIGEMTVQPNAVIFAVFGDALWHNGDIKDYPFILVLKKY